MQLLENFPLSDATYYHIGGDARYLLKVSSTEELKDAVKFCRDNKVSDIRVLGLGSNVLHPDNNFSGAVIWLEGAGTSHELVEDMRVKAFAGETVDSLILFSFEQSLIGLEWAGGLPSTIGGAIRGNAGAFGSEIKDTLFEVEAIDLNDPDLNTKTYSHTECSFSYRHSFFKSHPNIIIVSGTFQLHHGVRDEIEAAKAVYEKNIAYRMTHHPMEYPSCGSVFKNIIQKEEVEKVLSVWPDVRELSEGKWHNKVSMGYVINRLGFSGKRIGGAMVSPKHTNYIVNVDHAKAADIKQLIDEIQARFEETFGFTPEPEVIVLSDNS